MYEIFSAYKKCLVVKSLSHFDKGPTMADCPVFCAKSLQSRYHTISFLLVKMMIGYCSLCNCNSCLLNQTLKQIRKKYNNAGYGFLYVLGQVQLVIALTKSATAVR